MGMIGGGVEVRGQVWGWDPVDGPSGLLGARLTAASFGGHCPEETCSGTDGYTYIQAEFYWVTSFRWASQEPVVGFDAILWHFPDGGEDAVGVGGLAGWLFWIDWVAIGPFVQVIHYPGTWLDSAGATTVTVSFAFSIDLHVAESRHEQGHRDPAPNPESRGPEHR